MQVLCCYQLVPPNTNVGTVSRGNKSTSLNGIKIEGINHNNVFNLLYILVNSNGHLPREAILHTYYNSNYIQYILILMFKWGLIKASK